MIIENLHIAINTIPKQINDHSSVNIDGSKIRVCGNKACEKRLELLQPDMSLLDTILVLEPSKNHCAPLWAIFFTRERGQMSSFPEEPLAPVQHV